MEAYQKTRYVKVVFIHFFQRSQICGTSRWGRYYAKTKHIKRSYKTMFSTMISFHNYKPEYK